MIHQERIKKLQDLLKKANCDAIFIEDGINIFYLTGIELSAGKLFVHLNGAILLVDNRYFELCQKSSPCPVQLADKVPLAQWLASPEFSYIKKLAFDSASTSFKSFEEWNKIIQGLPEWKFVPLDNPVLNLRRIKDNNEIAILREAAVLGSAGFDYARTLLKEGITEAEVALELEIFWRRRGGKKAAFDPIIAFGANSSMPHYRAGNASLKKGDLVLMDIGVTFRNYQSDMTRVLFFGEPHPKLKEIYGVVKEAQQLALDACRPGITVGELDEVARGYIASKGYGDNFTHSLGHGIGLEVHELPALRNKPPHAMVKLEPGMVITIEPGVYLPNLGGVRIEDSVVITDQGYENLTNRLKELIVL